MTEFAGIFEVLASDQHDARLASRKALVLSRDRIDARLGKFLAASSNPVDFAARYELVADDFAGIVRVACDEVGHEDPAAVTATLWAHYHRSTLEEAKDDEREELLRKKEKSEDDDDSKESSRKSGKPPWLEDDDDDSDKKSDGDSDDDSDKSDGDDKSDKDDDDKDDHKAPPFGKKDSATDEDDDSDDKDKESKEEKEKRIEQDEIEAENVGGQWESKTADAVPLVPRTSAYQCECEHCGNRWKSHEQNPETCPQCGEMGEHETDEPEDTHDELGKQKGNKNGLFSSVHTADEGNTGLAGPSPKIDKKRWTPKSVKPIDVPSERHPTVQKDITEVMPKDNLTGPAHDMDEINAQTTTETLPTATDYDGGGFATGGEESGPNTKTFPKGDQASPVTKQIVEK